MNDVLQVLRFRRFMRPPGIIAVLLIGAVCSPAFAGKIVHYADTCLELGSGDVAGYVLIFQEGEPRPSISLSWSEGALKLPVAAKVTDYDRASGRLVFTVHDESGDFHFNGKKEPDRIQGFISKSWDGSSEHLELAARSRKAAFEPDTECRCA